MAACVVVFPVVDHTASQCLRKAIRRVFTDLGRVLQRVLLLLVVIFACVEQKVDVARPGFIHDATQITEVVQVVESMLHVKCAVYDQKTIIGYISER